MRVSLFVSFLVSLCVLCLSLFECLCFRFCSVFLWGERSGHTAWPSDTSDHVFSERCVGSLARCSLLDGSKGPIALALQRDMAAAAWRKDTVPRKVLKKRARRAQREFDARVGAVYLEKRVRRPTVKTHLDQWQGE